MDTELSNKIVSGLEKLSEVFRYLYWEKAKRFGLSPVQIQILLFMQQHREEFCKVSELAREFNLTKPTISDAVKVLIAKDFVSKEKSGLDKRSYILRLTENGVKLNSGLEDFSKPLVVSLAEFSPLDLKSFYGNITNLIYHLNRSGVIQVQRMCFNCKYYSDKDGGHYCNLMQLPLQTEDIRLDCPEFENAE